MAKFATQIFHLSSLPRNGNQHSMASETTQHELFTTDADRGTRLDRWVVAQCPELSRARVQELIDAGLVLVNGSSAKASQKLHGGERIQVEARQRPPVRAEAESIPLDVLFEDDDLLFVDKPAGMNVHAGAGNSQGTLVNALLGRGQGLSSGGDEPEDALRPGIVHRLDKETTGVIAIAKNDYAHAQLAEAFSSRTVRKNYIALAEGKLEKSAGSITFPIGRDPFNRTRMKGFVIPPKPAHRGHAGQMREARTDWHTLANFSVATLLDVQLYTGRTHQIRVHFSAIKHPLVGDTLYGAAPHLFVGKVQLPDLGRQFLHAARLGFPHPRTGTWVEARAPLPQDLRAYLRYLAAADGRVLDASIESL
jgi:23S rRNA pseudouridine1911/1915/1917 synthase